MLRYKTNDKNMVVQKVIFALITCGLLSVSAFAQKIRIKTGIEVLKETNFKILQGKRVGLITNPTGVDNRLKSTIDILHEAPGIQLVALYGPEHGVRGDVYAGDKIEDFKDPETGIPVFSLYGATRKPTPEMLQGLDVLVYDIQDIGCRSYTYISTLFLAMQAAAENNIEFVVLDRPNPLGGLKVEGNMVQEGFFSFVSQLKIPYVYGLTCGELAGMINAKMLEKPCRLTVVKMKKWRRKMNFETTGLPWVPTSPHIPFAHSAYFYPVSGILGELSYISIGVGYTLPFELFAADWITDAEELADTLNDKHLPGIIFRPIHIKPYYSVGQGKSYRGVQVYLHDFDKARLSDIQFHVMEAVALLYPEHKVFERADKKRFDMFDKVSGSDFIRKEFSKNYRFGDIQNFWTKDEETFGKLSKKYYLYK